LLRTALALPLLMEEGSQPHTLCTTMLSLLGTSYLGSRIDRTEQSAEDEERNVFRMALPNQLPTAPSSLYREVCLYHDALKKSKRYSD
jgi:hypothetical protein